MYKLIIFTSYPCPGYLNKDLVEASGVEKATKTKLEAIINTAHCTFNYNDLVGCSMDLYYTGKSYKSFESLLGNDLTFIKQQGSNIMERMKIAFKNAFSQGFDKVCLLHTNVLDLDIDIIKEAFLSLHSKDFVIGPASHGKYYLLGTKYYLKVIFEKLKWDNEVLKNTIKELEKANITYHLTKELPSCSHKLLKQS